MTNLTSPAIDSDGFPPIVLLVEDDRDTLEMYSAYFEMSGMWVATSTDAVEAIDAVDELKPDVIVTDVMFRGQPLGAEFVRSLKSDVGTQHIPVIMLTVLGVDEVPPPASQAADLCLEKPVLPDRLFASVRDVLSHSRARRQRGQALRETAQRASDRAADLAARARTVESSPDEAARACPECGGRLEWIERGRIGGSEYDYYRWCFKGCGLFCYDREARKWVKLA